MPRTARRKSESGIYHIMHRGINKQNIFEDRQDYIKMLELIKGCEEKGGAEIYAYCLMSNHIHLLIKEGKEPIETTIKRLAGGYAYWFNTKYSRSGHLFQDRYRSEPVEDDEYFLTVLRYIHFNPVKAGLCSKPESYQYSSYSEYLNGGGIINGELVKGMLPGKEFEKFHKKENDDSGVELIEKERSRISDEKAARIMRNLTKFQSAEEFQSIEQKKKNALIAKLKDNGLSIRQISRLTGESYYTIQRI